MWYRMQFATLCLFGFEMVIAYEPFMKPLFNTKTPYFWVRDPNEVIHDNQYTSVNNTGQICQLEGLNVLFRHGGRYPTLKWIKWMTQLQTKLSADSDVVWRHAFIRKWSNPFPESMEGLLSNLGEREMLLLGRRFSNRFRSVFEVDFNHINFTVTRKSRTRRSYEYFYQGLNETIRSNMKMPVPIIDNGKLRYYDYCHKYITDVDENSKTLTEYNAFLNGKEMTEVVRKVGTRLGYYNLSADEVVVMNQICVFELGTFNRSDWCKLFDKEDLLVIDYLKNLEDYYEKGYANPINWEESCPFTSYMFSTFDQVIQTTNRNSTRPKMNIAFGHGETVMPIYAAFGLFKDPKPLRADNYEANRNRTYRGAVIGGFSANIAFALYNCGQNNHHVIKIYVNEEAITIPACGQKTCSYTDVRKFYSKLENCNFNQICQNYFHKPAVG